MHNDTQFPQVSVGHVTLNTDRMDDTIRFMLSVGMHSVFQGPEVSVLELRGGTHLLLFHTDERTADEATFDLMVDDLQAMHARLAGLGYETSAIRDMPEIEHRTFDVREPAGTRITFFSSHAVCRPAHE